MNGPPWRRRLDLASDGLGRFVGAHRASCPVLGRRTDDIVVEVLVDGTWYSGWLDPDWVRHNRASRRWTATLRWQSAPAENGLGGFNQGETRRARGVASTMVKG
jgi:hypothetical protein